MDNQLVTIKGIYQDGQILPLSTFLPKGEFQVLITFLEPISDQEADEANSVVSTLENQDDYHEFRISQLGISKREYEILKLVQKGFTNQEISTELEIGDGTTRNYVSSLLHKMKADNRTMLVNLAIEKRLLAP